MKRMAAGLGAASMKHNAEVMLPIAGRKFANLDERMRDLDLMGIDKQVVCPSPHIYSYWADAALAEELVGLANEAMTDVVAAGDGRLAAMGMALGLRSAICPTASVSRQRRRSPSRI